MTRSSRPARRTASTANACCSREIVVVVTLHPRVMATWMASAPRLVELVRDRGQDRALGRTGVLEHPHCLVRVGGEHDLVEVLWLSPVRPHHHAIAVATHRAHGCPSSLVDRAREEEGDQRRAAADRQRGKG